MNRLDLHMHSSVSDGSDSIIELLEKVLDSGITMFSVTDHDTIVGACIMEKLVPDGIHYIKGVEFSCITDYGKCHILGYDYDPMSPDLQKALKHGKKLRRKKLDARLEGMDEKFGIQLTDTEMNWLMAQHSPGKPHLAKILVARDPVNFPDNRTAITSVINHCESPNSRIQAEEAVSAILKAGGVPVWAHPLGGEGEDPITKESFEEQLKYLKNVGIKGLECFYSRYSKKEIDFLQKAAKKNRLYISGGSDYHGTNKVNITLGKLNKKNKDVPEGKITLPCAFGIRGY